MTDLPPVLTVTAVSTIEVTNVEDEDHPDNWMAVETTEQGRLLLNLPGPIYLALRHAMAHPMNASEPGHLALAEDEIERYRQHIAGLS
ncbi:hypothetical protein ACFY1P_21825 [Streptomyces sp. NPDC001407]|uniref:hypothetical protein n=1 Tax=unclassified Streptomyces TaxID=2593676 RepID=UPI0036D113B6